jgi:hypothetical protein
VKRSPKAAARAKEFAELDHLVGNYIKARAEWCCERCGKYWPPGVKCETMNRLTSAHVKTKGRYGLIRFEPDNLMALCWLPCHDSWWHKDPADAMRWFNAKWPGRLERIEIAARCAPKLDLNLLLQIWRKEVASVREGSQ